MIESCPSRAENLSHPTKGFYLSYKIGRHVNKDIKTHHVATWILLCFTTLVDPLKAPLSTVASHAGANFWVCDRTRSMQVVAANVVGNC
jgi:hypothetical protein